MAIEDAVGTREGEAAERVRLAVTGATGRMGGTVLELAADHPAFEVVLAASRAAGPVEPATEVRVPVSVVEEATIEASLRETAPDVLVDFTVPDATARYARAAAAAEVAFVTGTTGLDDGAERALESAAGSVPVLSAPNFAPGVAVLERLVGEAAAALEGYDVEVIETHHSGKRDAPSGTANSLVDAVLERREGASPVHGRSGIAPRSPAEIGVHAVRAGDVAGEHRVLLAGDGETLSLAHRVGDREVFAAGALEAVAAIVGRDPGRYAFADLVGAGHGDREVFA